MSTAPDPYAPPGSDLISSSGPAGPGRFRFMSRPIEVETRFGDVLITNSVLALMSPFLWIAGMLLGLTMVVGWIRAVDLTVNLVVVAMGAVWVLGMMASMAVVAIFGAVLLSPATLLIPDALGTQTISFDRDTITEVTGGRSKRWPWKRARHVRIIGRLLVIRVSRFSMIVIAERNLDTRGDFLRLYYELHACHQAARKGLKHD